MTFLRLTGSKQQLPTPAQVELGATSVHTDLEAKKPLTDKQKKVKKVMDEWKKGKLHSGTGKKGKKGKKVSKSNQKKAVAIALSEADKMAAGKNWIKDAIKNPGSLRKKAKAKSGKKIPAKKLAQMKKAAQKKGDTKTLKKIALAKTLSNLNKQQSSK